MKRGVTVKEFGHQSTVIYGLLKLELKFYCYQNNFFIYIVGENYQKSHIFQEVQSLDWEFRGLSSSAGFATS